MTRSIFEQVKALIERLRPEPVCSACVSARLTLDDVDLAGRKLQELAGMSGFESQHGACSLCEQPGKIIRRTARS